MGARRSLLPLGLLVGLLAGALASGPADAAKKEAKILPASAEADAKPMPTMEERTAAFGAIDEAYKAGRLKEAADLLVALTENTELAHFHAESYARLGGILEKLDLPYGALVAYERALATDAPLVAGSAASAIQLADKVGDTALLEGTFAENVGLDVPAPVRSRMAYLAARESHHKGQDTVALAILKMVQKDDPYLPEAKSLEGVLLSTTGKPEAALAPFLTAQAAGAAAGRGAQFNDVMVVNLARSYYAAENWPRAVEYFAQVTRDSRMWPEVQFERAWAHFRMEDMNGALALLQNHTSPFFADWYFPEGELLRVHSLFLMCKFPEASKQIDSFRTRYAPVQTTLQQVAATDPGTLFAEMRKHVEGEKSSLPAMITWRFEVEERFLDDLNAIRHAEDELKRVQSVSANPFTEWTSRQVSARKAALIQAEGERIRARAAGMEAQLGQMLSDAEMSKLDMMQFETRLFEQAANRGELAEARDTVVRAARVKDGYRAWPFEGEYWGDELGYYRINAKPDCPAGMAAGSAR
jgi:tetratricopeptide (TPR) repeat protein